MSDWVKCDCCGNYRKNDSRGRVTSWLHVERDTPLMGQHPDFDFCSWACAEEFARRERQSHGRAKAS